MNASRRRFPIRPPPWRLALTLIEMLVVLVIMAVLAAVAVPRFGSADARHRVDVAARRVVADLELARQRARAASGYRSVVFDPAGALYRLPGVPHPDRPGSSDDYTVELGRAPYGASIIAVDFGGDATIVFDGFGTPDSGGGVTIRVGGYTRTVTVDPQTGNATVPPEPTAVN